MVMTHDDVDREGFFGFCIIIILKSSWIELEKINKSIDNTIKIYFKKNQNKIVLINLN
jgi:hypothetical protein